MKLDNQPATLIPYVNPVGDNCEGILLGTYRRACPIHGSHIESVLVFGQLYPPNRTQTNPWTYLAVPAECVAPDALDNLEMFVAPDVIHEPSPFGSKT